MRLRIATGVVAAIASLTFAAAPALAYLGETAFYTCASGDTLYTTVLATMDHHHRMSGTNYDIPGTGSTFYRTTVYWYVQSGQWTTGTYNGSYSYSGSGGGCA